MKDTINRSMITYFDWFNLSIMVLLAVLYIGGRVPPTQGNGVWAFNFLMPFGLILNIILFIVTLLLKKMASLPYFLLLLVANNYLFSSFGFKFLFKKREKTPAAFSVLNYNVSSLYSLNTEILNNLPPNPRAIQLKDWIVENNSDIQCYQEFINFPGHSDFDLGRKLEENGFHVYFSSNDKVRGSQVGILIASRFPIIRKGDVVTSKANYQFHFNRIMFVDVRIQNDTVRVVNFHLASMALKNHNPLTKRGMDDVIDNGRVILERLRGGVVDRSRQVDELINFIEKSPYRVICAGDFNDLPYTYSYHAMKKVMRNTFEEQGKGFGFTYNGNLLKTLRIDNQFYSKGISPLDFETLDQVKLSDHYPVIGHYKLIER